jgi:enamine deaminase RidA (YjgF/YER057c/UK114 family)
LRTEHTSGLAIEEQFGYSRAVSAGDVLYTSATAPVDANLTVVGDDAYQQATYVFGKLRPVFNEAGYQLADVVRACVYLVDTDDLADVGRAFHDAFAPARPALTVVHVQPYSLPGLRLEIELTAHRSV